MNKHFLISKQFCQLKIVGAAYLIVAFFSSIPILASMSSASTQIHISLLGQPCTMQGPHDANTLKIIHSIGPDQLYPNIATADMIGSLTQTKKALEKIHSTSDVPPTFDRYKERLRKRLGAQSAFLAALLEAQKKPRKVDQNRILLTTVDEYLEVEKLSHFELLLKKNNPSDKTGHLNRETLDTLLDFFNESIEPDPESEFHRAMKKMGVQYMCSFDR